MNGFIQPPVQALFSLVQRSKLCLGHGTQTSQNRPLTGLHKDRRTSQRLLCQIYRFHIRRHQRKRIFFSALPQQSTDRRGRGGGYIAYLRRIVGIALAGNGQRLHGKSMSMDALAVFHTQNIVGILQQRSLFLRQQTSHRFLTRRRKADAGSQFLFQLSHQVRIGQRFRQMHQRLRVTTFTAKGQMRDDTGGSQHLYATIRKTFRRRNRPGQRQFQHQIRTALHRSFGPSLSPHQCKIAPLDKVTAHHAHDGRILAQSRPNLFHQVDMASMQRIILCNNTCNFHVTPQIFRQFYVFLEKGGCNLGNLCYN